MCAGIDNCESAGLVYHDFVSKMHKRDDTYSLRYLLVTIWVLLDDKGTHGILVANTKYKIIAIRLLKRAFGFTKGESSLHGLLGHRCLCSTPVLLKIIHLTNNFLTISRTLIVVEGLMGTLD